MKPTHSHYGYKHSYSSIDTSHRPFQMLSFCRNSWYTTKDPPKMLDKALRVDDQSPVLPDLHVNNQHYHYCYKHSYSRYHYKPCDQHKRLLLGGSWYSPKGSTKVYWPRSFRVDDQSPFSWICTWQSTLPLLLQAQLFEYRHKPPTLSDAAFCGGAILRKDPKCTDQKSLPCWLNHPLPCVGDYYRNNKPYRTYSVS
jgi:hypothetical protein